MTVDWLHRFFSRVGLKTALSIPVAVFVLLDVSTQLMVLRIWGGGESLLHWEWSAVTIPTLAFLAGYLVAVAAVISQMKRLGWWRLLDSNRTLDAIRLLSWREFERVVAAAFADEGWTPELVGQNGPDGGVDLILHKGKQVAIVQCKQRRFPHGAYVEEREVREFAGVIAARKAQKGFMVTSGVFTNQAVEFAEKVQQVKLITGDDLQRMIGRCPKCKGAVTPKRGRYGVFLGCVRYPDCTGSINLAA